MNISSPDFSEHPPERTTDVPSVNVHSDVLNPEERLWIALQYVLSELNDSAAAEFELLLEHDSAACESLVEATRLVAALSETCGQFHRRRVAELHEQSVRKQSAESESASEQVLSGITAESGTCRRPDRSMSIRSPKFRGLTAAIALAACGVFLLVFSGLTEFPERKFTPDSSDGGNRMAVNRRGDGTVLARELLDFYVSGNPDDLPGASSGADELDGLLDDADLSVPEWLFAAIELQSSNNSLDDSTIKASPASDSVIPDEEFETEIF